MSISGALSNALSGMSAASRRAEVTSHNIANASTEGYARQRVTTAHHVVDGRGSGVLLEPTEADYRAAPDREASRRRRSVRRRCRSGGRCTGAC